MTRENCFTSSIQYEIEIFVNKTSAGLWKVNRFSVPILSVYVKKNDLDVITEIEGSLIGGSVC